MKNKNKITFLCLLACLYLVGLSTSFAQKKLFANLEQAIKVGQTENIVPYLNDSVELHLDTERGIYSSTKTKLFFNTFFKRYPPKDFDIIHEGSVKGGIQFAIGWYISDRGNYNVLLRAVKIKSTYRISKMSFVRE